MGKRVVKIWDLPSSGTLAALLILSVTFLLGAFAGCLLAKQVGGEGNQVLADYLQSYLSTALAGQIPRPEWFTALWETVRWPLFVFVFSFTPLGLLGIPIVFFIRSFLLSFSVASFFCVLGGPGLVLAFAVFGVAGLICIPVLFFLGIQGFLNAGTLTGRLLGENKMQLFHNRMFLLHYCVCAVALLVCCFIEYRIIPDFIMAIAGFMSA